MVSENEELIRNATIVIYSLKGEELLRKKIKQQQEEISVAWLSIGAYAYVVLDKKENKIASGKLIIQ